MAEKQEQFDFDGAAERARASGGDALAMVVSLLREYDHWLATEDERIVRRASDQAAQDASAGLLRSLNKAAADQAPPTVPAAATPPASVE